MDGTSKSSLGQHDSFTGLTPRNLDARLERLELHAKRGREFAKWLLEKDSKRGEKLSDCASWLHFKRYAIPGYSTTDDRLSAANFCQQPLLCGACAAGRAARHVIKLADRLKTILHGAPDLVPWFVTLTTKSQPDLSEMVKFVWGAWSRCVQARRNALKGQRASVWAAYDGGFVSGEAKRGSGGHGWHYHLHGVLLGPPGDRWELVQRSWSEQVDHYASVKLDPLRSYVPGKVVTDWHSDLIETCKYALKFGDQSYDDHWDAFGALTRVVNLRCFGSFRGVDLPDVFGDDLSDCDGLSYSDVFYRYLNGSYSEVKHSQDISELLHEEFLQYSGGMGITADKVPNSSANTEVHQCSREFNQDATPWKIRREQRKFAS